jgi:heterodisulfide reductase subunit B
VEIRGFSCCGYPVRNFDFKTSVLFAARNLALAARERLHVITLCKCCFGSLKNADHRLKNDDSLREEINAILRREDLTYQGDSEVRHLLSVLYHEVGIESIGEKQEKRFTALNVATHYGCHALRPSQVLQFDDPVAPSIFDELVEVTGAKSISWAKKLECCGAPLLGINDDLSMILTEKKLTNGKLSGAHCLCAACPYCQIQFDMVQKAFIAQGGRNDYLPSILYPQLLGLSMGIDQEKLGLRQNQLPIEDIGDFLAAPGQAEEADPG